MSCVETTQFPVRAEIIWTFTIHISGYSYKSHLLYVFSDGFRTVLDGFRMVSDGFEWFSDRFGSFRTVLDGFRTVRDGFRIVSDGFRPFRTVFGPFRIISDGFRIVSDRFRIVSDEPIFFFQISNFNWPGLGPRRAEPRRRAEPGPSPGQLKFEI